MPYQPIAHGKLQPLDYRALRPFIKWYRPELMAGIEEWLSLDPPRLELATLALDELRTRNKKRAKEAEQIFKKVGIQPVEWLPGAHRLSASKLKASSVPGGKGRLYVILRSGYTPQNGTYGAYVGVTAKMVEQRYLEHRTGIKAAKGLEKHGIELLYSLFDWANPIPGSKDARLRRETDLHRLLSQVIPKVSGDVVD